MKITPFALILIWGSLIHSAVFADGSGPDSCSWIDLSKDLGEVRAQEEANWCYAYGAADLITFFLKQRVSAADIAFREIKDVRELDDILDTPFGSMSRAVESTLQAGACLEARLPSLPYQLQAELTKNPVAFWKWVDQACQDRILLPRVRAVKEFLKKKALIRRIDEVLQQNNVIEIRVDASIFKTSDVGRQKVNHDVVIAGRRWNSKKERCEYKVRTSWSTNCTAHDYRDDIECENGNLWMPEKDLMRASKNSIYLIAQ